jgi:O-methyltransferase
MKSRSMKSTNMESGGMKSASMKNVTLRATSEWLKVPWYGFWTAVQRTMYDGREYPIQVPSGRRSYAPWFNSDPTSDFTRAFHTVTAGGPITATPDACYMLYQFARRSVRLPGHMAECGVYRGGSAQLLSWVIHGAEMRGIRLHLFDTFTGTPDHAVPERDHDLPGYFANTSVEAVKARLRPYAEFCDYHPGLIPATFADVSNVGPFSLVHVEVDLYSAVLECCQWFWPRLTPGGVMIFTAYGAYPYRHAVRVAVDEFFSKEADKPLVLPTAQAVVIKSSMHA